MAGVLRGSPSPLGRFYGDSTKIVALCDLNAAMAQNCIGGCDMEMEVRQQKVDEIIGAVHMTRGRPERECDLTLGRRIDRLAVERFEIRDRSCQSRLELIDGRLVVFVVGWLDPREARGTIF